MADLVELMSEVVDVLREISDKLDRGAPNGSATGASGPSSLAGAGSTRPATAAGRVGAQLGGSSLASLAGKAAGGLALTGLASVANAAIDVAQAGVQGGATSFLTSGGSFAAASGGFDRGVSGALNSLGVGQFTGDSAALNISQRAQADVGRLAEAAARAGGPLSKEQLTALTQQSQARETRVEDARRLLGTVSDEQFGEVKETERDKAGDRFSAAVDKLIGYLDGRSAL